MAKKIESAEGYGKFKFELAGIASRVVVIPEHITLFEVHKLIQALFDWKGCHLWEFQDPAGRKFKYKSEDRSMQIFDEGLVPPADACLSDVLPARGGKLVYTYDFGDDWRHVVTRMAPPKSPGCYCVKTEGPDGIEDIGGGGALFEYKEEWHVPDAGEITARLERINLHPKKSGTGLVEKRNKALDDAIKSLSEYEWAWLEKFGEDGFGVNCNESERIRKLLRLLPGVRRLDFASAMRSCGTYDASSEFKRYWRKMRDKWLQMRGNATSSGETSQGPSPDTMPKALQDQLYAFACAAACLYGIVGEKDLCDLLEKWRKDADLPEGDMKETASCAMQLVRRKMFSRDAPAYFWNGMAVSSEKYPPDVPESEKAISNTLKLRSGKQRWDPDSYEQFLDNRDGSFAGSGEYDELERFIDKTWELDPKDEADTFYKKDAVAEVYYKLAPGYGWQTAVNVLRECFDMSDLSAGEFCELAKIMVKAANATRHDANWGWTPNEMVAMHGRGDVIDTAATQFEFAADPTTPTIRGEAKTGRNDPCPCGSGKKYKKCCGREK